MSGLTNLTWLNLVDNSISDISPLVENAGLGDRDVVFAEKNPLSYLAINTHIPILQAERLQFVFDDQAHPALLKIAGDGQKGASNTPLENPFVVEMQDANGAVLAGVSVTFTVTSGGGTLSVTSVTTDANGSAGSTLTLGPDLGTNTVEVYTDGVEGTVTFHAIADREGRPVPAPVEPTDELKLMILGEIKRTALIQNFPNPFNPETWIPYQLSIDADVKFTIYDTKGEVVRQFDLGHQATGYYTNRTKAAYWDGRNHAGEPVGSGVYFYRITAGDYSATRKMVVLK